jgi:hypothetical protein
MWGIFCKILSVQQNIVIDLNNVMQATSKTQINSNYTQTISDHPYAPHDRTAMDRRWWMNIACQYKNTKVLFSFRFKAQEGLPDITFLMTSPPDPTILEINNLD